MSRKKTTELSKAWLHGYRSQRVSSKLRAGVEIVAGQAVRRIEESEKRDGNTRNQEVRLRDGLSAVWCEQMFRAGTWLETSLGELYCRPTTCDVF